MSNGRRSNGKAVADWIRKWWQIIVVLGAVGGVGINDHYQLTNLTDEVASLDRKLIRVELRINRIEKMIAAYHGVVMNAEDSNP